jgi:hypothetical protein
MTVSKGLPYYLQTSFISNCQQLLNSSTLVHGWIPKGLEWQTGCLGIEEVLGA